jgi:hypothetical protein
MRAVLAVILTFAAVPVIADDRLFACTPKASASTEAGEALPEPFFVKVSRPGEALREAACGSTRTKFVCDNFGAFLSVSIAPAAEDAQARRYADFATDESMVANGSTDDLDPVFFNGRNGLSRFSLSTPSDGPVTYWRLDVATGTPGAARVESGTCRTAAE